MERERDDAGKGGSSIKAYVEGLVELAVSEGMDEDEVCQRIMDTVSARRNRIRGRRPLRLMIQ